jgi:beta-lactamase class A
MPVDALANELETRLTAIAQRAEGATLGVGVLDYQSGAEWRFNADRWFHAASLIKLPVLVALFQAFDQGRFNHNARLSVRNRFLSVADGNPFRVELARDSDPDVHAAIGRTLRLGELAQRMIVRSSNLATNLLVDLLGVDAIRASLSSIGVDGIDVRRGVEDDRAFERDINNRVTPRGVVHLLRAIVGSPAISPEASSRMIDILLDQQFAGTIVPGLPEPIRAVARVAHKTGDISTASHDAGIVFLPGRPPYIVSILVESSGDARDRLEAAVTASTAIYECVAAAGERTSR